MKTISFPNVELFDPIKIGYIERNIQETPNGLYGMLYNGYSSHIPIVLRPDDILNNVASIWSKYVVIHAEKLRSFFVSHDGKKELTYYSGGFYSNSRMPEFMDGMSQLIINDQKDDKITWACKTKFSTSTYEDKLIRSTAILASQKKYYEYNICLACGFPKIQLEGSEEDWSNLVRRRCCQLEGQIN